MEQEIAVGLGTGGPRVRYFATSCSADAGNVITSSCFIDSMLK